MARRKRVGRDCKRPRTDRPEKKRKVHTNHGRNHYHHVHRDTHAFLWARLDNIYILLMLFVTLCFVANGNFFR